MSNSQIFLKSVFPRAPLENALGRYICQLQRITLKFCKSHGSSRGMRDFLVHNLLDFSKQNPGIVVYVKPRRHRAPVMVAEYLNGSSEWINCRNNTREEINKWIQLLHTQNGPSSSLRLRKMWHTEIPSIQGSWTPFTLKYPETNLVIYPNEELSEILHVEKSASETLMEMFEKQKLDSNDILHNNRAK